MKTRIFGSIISGLVAGVLLLANNGCNNTTAMQPPPPLQTPGVPGAGQPTYGTDTDAMTALVTAVKAADHDQVHTILGPAWKEVISGDKVEDASAFKEFADHVAEHSQLQKKNATTSIIFVGKDNWPFPIPIVQTPDGKWFFDTESGKSEIQARHVGENELNAIQVCRDYVQAQRDYASKPRDSSGICKYAQQIVSSPGLKNGLYWEVPAGEEQSPFGPLLAQAADEGYAQTQGHPNQAYMGYHFKVLKSQGLSAPGGSYDYVINGNMIAGFAMVAYPEDYQQSGIMTFIISHQGKLYQKDLGVDTKEIARNMTEYNPDDSWTLVAK